MKEQRETNTIELVKNTSIPVTVLLDSISDLTYDRPSFHSAGKSYRNSSNMCSVAETDWSVGDCRRHLGTACFMRLVFFPS